MGRRSSAYGAVNKNKICLTFGQTQILSTKSRYFYLNNEQLLNLLRPVFFSKNSIGYVGAMVVSDSLKLYVRKEMHCDTVACNLAHCRQTLKLVILGAKFNDLKSK